MYVAHQKKACARTHTHTHTHTHARTHARTHTHTCVCICACLYACIYTYIYAFHVYIYIYVSVYTCISYMHVQRERERYEYGFRCRYQHDACPSVFHGARILRGAVHGSVRKWSGACVGVAEEDDIMCVYRARLKKQKLYHGILLLLFIELDLYIYIYYHDHHYYDTTVLMQWGLCLRHYASPQRAAALIREL